MSFRVMGSKATSWVRPVLNWVQKRYAHRSPSWTYLNLWKDHQVDYAQQMSNDVMRNSPQMVSQVLRLEAAMRMGGLVPFVHAMPASSKVLLELYETVSPTSSTYVPIRSPFESQPTLEEVRKQVPKEGAKCQQRPELLCVSYALTCNTVPLESAASWGFSNHFGNQQYFPMVEHLDAFLTGWQRSHGRQVPASLKDRGRSLIREYNRLKVGQFFVLGVPSDKLSAWMYDSKPFYVPTGKDIQSVVEKPMVTADEGTIGILMLAKEVLNPTSGLVVMPVDRADPFCKEFQMVDPNQVELYQSITRSTPTEFERGEREVRDQLDAKLKQFSADFRTWSATGYLPADAKPEEEVYYDFPQSLP